MNESEDFRNRRFLFMIMYEGPWERLSNWCWGLRRDGSLRWEVPMNPRGLAWLLAGIGNWAERRDHAWRTNQVLFRRTPTRWERRSQ